jgi:hypothetical protein
MRGPSIAVRICPHAGMNRGHAGATLRAVRVGTCLGAALCGVALAGCAYSHDGSTPQAAKPPAALSTQSQGVNPDYVLLPGAPKEVDTFARRWIRASVTRRDLLFSWNSITTAWQAKNDRSQWLAGTMPIVPEPNTEQLDRIEPQLAALFKDGRLFIRYSLIGHVRKGGKPVRRDYFITLLRQAGTWKVSFYSPYAPPPPLRVQ